MSYSLNIRFSLDCYQGFGSTRSQVRILSPRSFRDRFPSLSFFNGTRKVARKLQSLVFAGFHARLSYPYSHWGLTRFHPEVKRSFHRVIARFLLIFFLLLRRGIPLGINFPLSISTFGFCSQLSQSYLNLNIHIPSPSLIQPSRFIDQKSSTEILPWCDAICL